MADPTNPSADRPSARIAIVVGLAAIVIIGVAGFVRSLGAAEADLRSMLVEAGVHPRDPEVADPALYALGSALFFDPILSGNRDVSCATCHEPALATSDRQSLSIGTGGFGRGDQRELGNAFLHVPRNAPDLFNRGDNEWHTFFWDGRVSLQSGAIVTPAGDALPPEVTSIQVAQALITIASPIEMRGFAGDVDVNGAGNELSLFAPDQWEAIWDATFARLVEIDEYRELLGAAYPDVAPNDLRLHHAVEALVAFQADAFDSTGSPFDRFVSGERGTLTDEQLAGALLFYGEAGCSTCHAGSLLTDQRFYSIAAPQVGPGRGDVAPLDAGHGAIEGSGKIRFRTPPLRNVALTAPYLHDGAYWDLEDVVKHHLDPAVALAAYETSELRADVQVSHLDEIRAAVENSLSAELSTVELSDEEIRLVISFLGALTDPEALSLMTLVPPSVPSGLELYPDGPITNG